ncbi:MAG: response regulator [Bdellovibrionales bacterium]|nr:response regulator [Bdellovibrionales bacterium]
MFGLELSSQDKNFYFSRSTVAFFFLLIFAITSFPSTSWISNITNNYLPIHMVLEFLGILVSFGIFTVGWATYKNVRSTDILILAVVSFMVGWLDFGHTLSFSGMPDFVTASGPNKAIYFWLASRFAGSFGFLYVSLFKPGENFDHRLRGWLMLFATLWIGGWYYVLLFNIDDLPVMFVPGQGLTPLKVSLEWTIVLINLVAGFLFFKKARNNVVSYHWLGCTCFIFAMSGFFFTRYRDFDDLYNFAGHLYKAIGFVLLYRAVFIECVSNPYLEAQRARDEALAANTSKSRFLANVSHELRTPIAVIKGFTDILKSQTLGAEMRQWVEVISRNSKQLGLLIDDLLDLAKAENEKISIRLSKFSAVEIIDEIIQGLKLQAEKKQIQLTFTTEDTPCFIVSDKLRFRQILTNIIGNAIKFTHKGFVAVSLKRTDGEMLEITVTDSGIGISAEHIQKLFKPFHQADDPNLRRIGGTGLGLVLSKKMANLLHGDLLIAQTEMGKGSSFVFTLKNQTLPEGSEAPSRETATIPYDFSHLKILAAEDSEDNQYLLEMFMAPTNANLTFANNGREAVDLMNREQFDLILMDIQMPEMDGFEAVTHIRQKGWTGPIIALSAHTHQYERDRALSVGFTSYLVKPISRASLWEAVSVYSRGLNAP